MILGRPTMNVDIIKPEDGFILVYITSMGIQAP